MKIVLTGGAGHITAPAATALLAKGHAVTVIGRNAANLQNLVHAGAVAAVGHAEDPEFLTAAFQGADAVYLMIPPAASPAGSWRDSQDRITEAYREALVNSGVQRVVALSSIGAHLGGGTGPVDGVAWLEQQLSTLSHLDYTFLRPSFFYYNLFSQIPLIRSAGIMGGNYMGGDEPLVLTHTSDIASVLVEELESRSKAGMPVRYIAGDERPTSEIAAVLGAAIGQPGLSWVEFSDEQAMQGMLQAGLPATLAEGYTQLGRALRSGKLQEDYWKNPPEKGRIRLTDFASEFRAAFETAV